MNVGKPLLLQLWKVLDFSGVVAEKEHAVDVVARVDVVVHLGYDVVHTHVIVESVGDVDTGIVVKGEAAAVAGYRRTQGAARNLQTSWTHRDPSRL